MAKRLLSVIIAAFLLFSALPMMTVYAAESDELDETGVTVIDKVEISITPPNDGDRPSYSASYPANSGYFVDYDYLPRSSFWQLGVMWEDRMNNAMSHSLGLAFKAGYQYKVSVSLAPVSSDYEFSKNGLTATINGNSANVSYVTQKNNNIIISCAFTCQGNSSNIIDTFAVTDVIPPVAGETPTYSATVPSEANYMIDRFSNSYFVDGVAWEIPDSDYGMYGKYPTDGIKPDTVFVEGEKYIVRVFLVPKENYIFAADGLKATVNENDAVVGVNKTNHSIFIDYAFICMGTAQSPILGDADGSGEVDTVDATMIQRRVTQIKVPYDDAQLMNADVDGDGILTIVDATFIQRYCTKVTTPYKIGEAIE